MARKKTDTLEKTVDHDLLAKALARAVCQGDIVDFRLVFMPLSPGREESTEHFESEKYAYLLPDEPLESDKRFIEALAIVRSPLVWAHVLKELEAKRPAQLPSELLLPLADNAVRGQKYTSAAQAYELLRIRRPMQEEFFKQADEAIEAKDIAKAVRGYLIATGLAYDYAAFPEPLPRVPDFQTKALMLHGEYPTRPEDCVALQDEDGHANTAIAYLLNEPEAAARLRPLSLETRLAFLKEAVLQIDPEWDDFARRYREACDMGRAYGERLEQPAAGPKQGEETLEDEIDGQKADDAIGITQRLLGRVIEGGEWWQYLKEIAFEHPAGILFIARQAVGDSEILVPRYRPGSAVPAALGLIDGASAGSSPEKTPA